MSEVGDMTGDAAEIVVAPLATPPDEAPPTPPLDPAVAPPSPNGLVNSPVVSPNVESPPGPGEMGSEGEERFSILRTKPNTKSRVTLFVE